VHDVGVVLAGEDIAGAAHVRGQLVHLVEAAIDGRTARCDIGEVPDHEIIRLGGRVLGVFEVDASDPAAFALEALHEVTADEAPSSAYQNVLHGSHPPSPIDLTAEIGRFVR
jgi:hypothetical protein